MVETIVSFLIDFKTQNRPTKLPILSGVRRAVKFPIYIALIINLILGFSGTCKSAFNLKASTPQFKNCNKKTATKATWT